MLNGRPLSRGRVRQLNEAYGNEANVQRRLCSLVVLYMYEYLAGDCGVDT